VTLTDGGAKPNPFPRTFVPLDDEDDEELGEMLTLRLRPGVVSDPTKDWVTPVAFWKDVLCHHKLFHRSDMHIGLKIPGNFFSNEGEKESFTETFGTDNGTFSFRKMVALAMLAGGGVVADGDNKAWFQGMRDAIHLHTSQRVSPQDKRDASAIGGYFADYLHSEVMARGGMVTADYLIIHNGLYAGVWDSLPRWVTAGSDKLRSVMPIGDRLQELQGNIFETASVMLFC
jgi:hypothetical protein